MSTLTNLVEQIESMINTYGADAVKNALTFVSEFPQTKVKGVLDPRNGTYAVLTLEQYTTVAKLIEAKEKIQAIKHLREYASIGLREAKETVEYAPNWPTTLNTLSEYR